MLASRWAPSPDQQVSQAKDTVPGTTSTPNPVPNLPKASALSESPATHNPSKRRKVLWNGRQCIIHLSSRGGDAVSPLTTDEVRDRLDTWEAQGYSTRGFGLQHDDDSQHHAYNGLLHCVETDRLFDKESGLQPGVRLPDPKAWQAYKDWLVEEKLRALGVAGPGSAASPVLSTASHLQRSRTISPSNSLAFSQRLSPALSALSPVLHSRAMSTVSPFGLVPDAQGRAVQQSVYSVPQPSLNPTTSPFPRSFSPSQQQSLDAIVRATSPSFGQLVNPIPSVASPVDGKLRGPSPLSGERFSSTAAYSAPDASTIRLPSETGQGKPQQRSDDGDAVSRIHVPTPHGHRHNISEGLEKEIQEAEAILDCQASTENDLRPEPAMAQFQFQMNNNPFTTFRPGALQITGMGNPQLFPPIAQPPPAFMPNVQDLPPSIAPFTFVPHTNNPTILTQFAKSQPHHGRQQSTFNVAAPSFQPKAFGGSTNPSSNGFNFSFGKTFKPDAPVFQPGQPLKTTIFGDVHIPDDVRPNRRSKVVAVDKGVLPVVDDGLIEDESGRLVRSTERQKRNFRAGGDDGDSVPLFAEQPTEPVENPFTDHAAIEEASDMQDSGISEPTHYKDLLTERGDSLDVDDEPHSLDRDSSESDAHSESEDKENVPPQTLPGRRPGLHMRTPSSLSALAKPFEFNMPSIPTQRSPFDAGTGILPGASLGPANLDPQKPEFNPARIFSRDATGFSPGLDLAAEPTQSPEFPHGKLEREPSFDEIDEVMRQLNEDDSASAMADQFERGEESAPSPVEKAAEADDAKSVISAPGSVKVYDVADVVSRSVSPLDENDYAQAKEQGSPAAENSNDRPFSDWSEDSGSHAGSPESTTNALLEGRVEEVIGKSLEAHLQPLQEQMITLQRVLSEQHPPTSSKDRLANHPTRADSDADDEEDVVDSKFLSGLVSSKAARRFQLIKAAAMDALASYRPGPHAGHSSEIKAGFDLLHDRLDRHLGGTFDLKDVQEVVEEIMLKASTSFNDVPRPELTDDERHDHLSTKKLLRLAEEELESLRAASADKDARIAILEGERRELRDRAIDVEDAEKRLKHRLQDMVAENAAQSATLDEYRAAHGKWKLDLEQSALQNHHSLTIVANLEDQLADTIAIKNDMRGKIERIQNDMSLAAEQLASQKVVWHQQIEHLQKEIAVYETRLDAESQLRSDAQAEMSRLRAVSANGETLATRLENSLKTNEVLQETVLSLRDEVNERQTSNSRLHRELHEARENSRLEVQRAQLLMETGIEAANNQANAKQAGLESKLSVTVNELDNIKALMASMKSRHEVVLQEEADLRREALLTVNQASGAALEDLRSRHEEHMLLLREQHERALQGVQQDKDRSELFWNERLSLSEARLGHSQERITHLEERLDVAKSAAQAAAQAAQAAKSPAPSSTHALPEKISPQALRESILVLQDQLQERERRIESLTQKLSQAETSHPAKLKEKDLEITWLRELLAVRADDLAELTTTLASPEFDRAAARDAAIRIQTALQMEQAERERRTASSPSTLPAQAIAGFSGLVASPKLAAAIGSWRARGTPSGPTPSSLRAASIARQRLLQKSGDGGGREVATPKRASSPASWMAGLMTPPSSEVRRGGSPGSPSVVAAVAQGKRVGSSGGAGRRTPTVEGMGTGEDEPELSLRRASFDEDARDGMTLGEEIAALDGAEERGGDGELEEIG